MDDTKAQAAAVEQNPVSETPEDVAILYSWANMPGARYRDFSASRREYRAQQRARIAEQQRQAELQAATELEAAAQREFEEAQRIRENSRHSDLARSGSWDEQSRSRELVRRAEEHALRERQEAARRQQSAETLRVQAQRARSEMLDARKRAEEQAARYAETAPHFSDEVSAEGHAVPGQVSDPYYFTGQVDPAYFASTPGVRTAQATRLLSERRIYPYPVPTGTEEPDQGSLHAYRSNTMFAPSPSQTFRPVSSAGNPDARDQLKGRVRQRAAVPTQHVPPEPAYPADDAYYDGKPPSVPASSSDVSGSEEAEAFDRDILIRPVARTPDPIELAVQERAGEIATNDLPAEWNRSDTPLAISKFKDAVPPAELPLQSEILPERTVAHKAYVEGSSMFVEEMPPPPAQVLEETKEPAPLRFEPQALTEDSETVRETLVPQKAIGSPALEQDFHEIPEDSRIRLTRYNDRSVASSEWEDRSRTVPTPPSWLEPPGEQVQRFLPPRLRSGGESKPPQSTRAKTPSAPAVSKPAPQFVGRTQRYNRNLDRGRNSSAIADAFQRRRASLNREQVQSATGQGIDAPPAPDTLQQSRERVASRWYALKELMDPGQGLLEPGHAVELRTPALSVMSLSGGVGKTSIVATLGRALSAVGEKVLLVDANSHGLLPYYFGARELRQGTARTFTPPAGNGGAPVLLVKHEIEQVSRNEAAQRRVIEEIGRKARGSQRVVVDLGTSAAWLALRLAAVQPWVLVPVAPDTNSVVTTQTVERLFAEIVDVHGQPVTPYYVLNQYDASLPLHLDVREVLRRSLGERLLRVTLRRSPLVAEALAQGMTVIDYAPTAPVTEDYMNLANWLRGLSAPLPGAAPSTGLSER